MEEIEAVKNPNSLFSESIKNIRTNLKFANVDKKNQIIMITSSVPGEGKSYVSANLGATFASFSEKTLLIDCDLRKGTQNKYFEIRKNTKGLSNLLIDDNLEEKYKKYYSKTIIPNLWVMPLGVVPPNPSELLASSAMKNLLELLRNDFEYIILDCPPISGLNDALTVATLADSAIIIVKYKSTTMEMLSNTKKALENINTHIAGVVVNGSEVKHKSSYYNKYYNYTSI